MLELDGALLLQFSGALTVRNQNGSKVAEADIPLIDQSEIFAAGSSAALQGWERAGSTVTTNLGIVNLAHSVANCTVTVRLKDGLLAVQNVPITLQPLTSVQFDDALAILGISNATEGGRSEVSCNQGFFTYLSTYNDQTGEVEFIEASKTIAGSTLVEPTGTAPPPGPDPDPIRRRATPPSSRATARSCATRRTTTASTTSGSTCRSTATRSSARSWWTSTSTSARGTAATPAASTASSGSTMAQAGTNMFGYVNTRGTQNRTVFQVNATGGGWQETNTGGSPQPGGDYHMHYEYDLDEDTVFFRITHAGGGTVVTRAYSIRGTTFSTNRFFIEFGYQQAEEGPEAYTPGWTFSNLEAAFIP